MTVLAEELWLMSVLLASVPTNTSDLGDTIPMVTNWRSAAYHD